MTIRNSSSRFLCLFSVFIFLFGSATQLTAQRRADRSFGFQYSASTSRQLHFVFHLHERHSAWLPSYSVFSVAAMQDELDTKRFYVSANPAIFSAYYLVQSLGGPMRTLGHILLLPQIVGNFHYKFNIYEKYLAVVVGQRTDYFVVNNALEVKTESTAGLQYQGNSFQLRVAAFLPELEGPLKQKNTYWGASVFFNIPSL